MCEHPGVLPSAWCCHHLGGWMQREMSAHALPLRMELRQLHPEQHMLLVGCLVTLTESININHKQSLGEWSWPFCCNIWWWRPRYFYPTATQMFSSPDTPLYLAGKVVENVLVDLGRSMLCCSFFQHLVKNRLVIN